MTPLRSVVSAVVHQIVDRRLRFERVAVPPVRIHRNIQEQLPGEQQLIRDNIKANEEAYKKREIEARTIERKYGMSLEQQDLTVRHPRRQQEDRGGDRARGTPAHPQSAAEV